MTQENAETAERGAVIAADSVFTPIPKFDARGTAIVTLAVLATLFSLKLAAGFLIPVIVAILFAYALDPIVSWLTRFRFPRWLGAFVTLTVFILACGYGIYALRGQFQSIIDQVPTVTRRVSRALDGLQGSDESGLDKMRKAADAIQKATDKATAVGAAPVTRVIVEQPSSRLRDALTAGGIGLAAFAGEVTLVIFLVFFLLAAGDKFRRKFVKVAGRTLSDKKISVQMFNQINRSIQRYMLMLLVTNGAVGLASWFAFRLLGLENAGTWALASGVLHLIPYFGPGVTALVTGLAAFMQFGNLGMALLTAAVSLAIAGVIGVALTTWMIGRMAKMNSVAVFMSLLLFGAMWGVWGVLLSAPIAVIAKVISDHVEELSVMAEFLGD